MPKPLGRQGRVLWRCTVLITLALCGCAHTDTATSPPSPCTGRVMAARPSQLRTNRTTALLRLRLYIERHLYACGTHAPAPQHILSRKQTFTRVFCPFFWRYVSTRVPMSSLKLINPDPPAHSCIFFSFPFAIHFS
ncbi:hypothetical protein V1508DRAFT_71246 [Lipomyces doorenjongii]|uniref:uncharacterized protein n=1 Tax=Lipomyces doorenjongii TaxID=383834 RepID=UPI0034CDC52B